MKETTGPIVEGRKAKVDRRYHRMKSEDFDAVISSAAEDSLSAIRLPTELVRSLKRFAESEGGPEYEAMDRRTFAAENHL